MNNPLKSISAERIAELLAEALRKEFGDVPNLKDVGVDLQSISYLEGSQPQFDAEVALRISVTIDTTKETAETFRKLFGSPGQGGLPST